MAVRYRFKKDWDHSVKYGVDVAYKAGTEDLIPEAHADAADAAGAGERVDEGKKSKVEKAQADDGR